MNWEHHRSATTTFFLKAMVIAGISFLGSPCIAQTGPDRLPSAPQPTHTGPDPSLPTGSQPLQINRVFGLVPVSYALPLADNHVAPLSDKQKFQFFFRTVVDPGTVVIAAVGAGISGKASTQPAYGGGAAAFGQKTGAVAADYASNTLFSRSLLPMVFHQDPRFFRMEDGSVRSRLLYGATRSFITQADSGHSTFNASFLGGYAMSVALSNSYYPDCNRNAADSASRYAEGIGIDMAINVIREFWKLRR